MERRAKIGQGRYSTVYAGNFSGNRIDACKQVRLSLSDSPVAHSALKAVLREILALTVIGYDPNIVGLNGYSVSRGSVQMFLDYCDWDLDKLLTHCDLNIPVRIVEGMAKQIFTGISVIHSFGLCHRDIKPSNILLCSYSGLLKISDFGLARPATGLLADSENLPVATREVCTRWYKAIEVLLGSGQSQAMDVWSAALVVAELLNHSPLFPGISDINQIFLIYQAFGEPRVEDWPEFGDLEDSRKLPFSGERNIQSWDKLVPRASPCLVELISGCLVYNPKRRLLASAICDLEISTSPEEISKWIFSIYFGPLIFSIFSRKMRFLIFAIPAAASSVEATAEELKAAQLLELLSHQVTHLVERRAHQLVLEYALNQQLKPLVSEAKDKHEDLARELKEQEVRVAEAKRKVSEYREGLQCKSGRVAKGPDAKSEPDPPEPPVEEVEKNPCQSLLESDDFKNLKFANVITADGSEETEGQKITAKIDDEDCVFGAAYSEDTVEVRIPVAPAPELKAVLQLLAAKYYCLYLSKNVPHPYKEIEATEAGCRVNWFSAEKILSWSAISLLDESGNFEINNSPTDDGTFASKIWPLLA